ncbi:hypothetical protein CBL_11519 [Carabus blaptoides fortunei]
MCGKYDLPTLHENSRHDCRQIDEISNRNICKQKYSKVVRPDNKQTNERPSNQARTRPNKQPQPPLESLEYSSTKTGEWSAELTRDRSPSHNGNQSTDNGPNPARGHRD